MAIRVNPTVVAVAPVSTALFDPLTVGAQGALSIQVENLDATETFSGTVRTRLDPDNDMASSTIGDLQGIGPGQSVVVSLSLPANAEVDVVGTMTGAGGNVRVTALPRASTSIAMGRTR